MKQEVVALFGYLGAEPFGHALAPVPQQVPKDILLDDVHPHGQEHQAPVPRHRGVGLQRQEHRLHVWQGSWGKGDWPRGVCAFEKDVIGVGGWRNQTA